MSVQDPQVFGVNGRLRLVCPETTNIPELAQLLRQLGINPLSCKPEREKKGIFVLGFVSIEFANAALARLNQSQASLNGVKITGKILPTSEEQRNTVHLANVPFNAKVEEIRIALEHFGKVSKIVLPMDPIWGSNRGFAFATFENHADKVKLLKVPNFRPENMEFWPIRPSEPHKKVPQPAKPNQHVERAEVKPKQTTHSSSAQKKVRELTEFKDAKMKKQAEKVSSGKPSGVNHMKQAFESMFEACKLTVAEKKQVLESLMADLTKSSKQSQHANKSENKKGKAKIPKQQVVLDDADEPMADVKEDEQAQEPTSSTPASSPVETSTTPIPQQQPHQPEKSQPKMKNPLHQTPEQVLSEISSLPAIVSDSTVVDGSLSITKPDIDAISAQCQEDPKRVLFSCKGQYRCGVAGDPIDANFEINRDYLIINDPLKSLASRFPLKELTNLKSKSKIMALKLGVNPYNLVCVRPLRTKNAPWFSFMSDQQSISTLSSIITFLFAFHSNQLSYLSPAREPLHQPSGANDHQVKRPRIGDSN